MAHIRLPRKRLSPMSRNWKMSSHVWESETICPLRTESGQGWAVGSRKMLLFTNLKRMRTDTAEGRMAASEGTEQLTARKTPPKY